MLRRFAIAAPLVLATAAVLWSGLILPPPMWIVKYGPTPGCEPTGEVVPVEGIEFVVIGPGISRMGSDWLAVHREQGATAGDLFGRLSYSLGQSWGEAPVPSNEMPVHWTEFPHGFAVARTEIANEQYRRFLNANPAFTKPDRSLYGGQDGGPAGPVTGVVYGDATQFCAWLAERSGLPVRLPSEAEALWRAQEGSQFGLEDRILRLEPWEFQPEGAPLGTIRLESFDPWEWCEDRWHAFYRGAPCNGSAWVTSPTPVPGQREPAHVVVGGDKSRFHFGSVAILRSWAFESGAYALSFRPAFTPSDR